MHVSVQDELLSAGRAGPRHFADGVLVVKNVLIPMRDGLRLAADLYAPEELDGPLPIVMEYIPYRKDEVAPGTRFYTQLARSGYIVARVDIRGTGASEGNAVDEYVLQEQLDGFDAVEWLASQPYCDGHVNIMGISYGGFTALQIATHQPPHLTSIIPMYFTDDRYTDDCHCKGGLLRNYYDVGHYGNFMIAYNALPPYPEWSGEDWATIWEQHLDANEPYLLRWLTHQTDGAYWRQGSVGDLAHRIACPVFMIGGWRDGYTNPPLRLYEKLRVPKKVLIGPWNHALPDVAIPGPRIDYLREVVRWLDHWCRGRDDGILDEPPIVVFMQRFQAPDVGRLESVGEWRAEASWPVPDSREFVEFLDAGGVLSPTPGADGSCRYPYVPTVGLTAGLWSAGVPFGLAGDQRPDEALSLVYTSSPLDDYLSILGRPTVYLHVSSTASVIGFAVALSEVAPDGTSHLIAKGMLNSTRRHSLTDPEPLVPGEAVELPIEIDATGWTFGPGNRIRLSVSSADWPNVWPTPQPAINTVYRGPANPSRLVLPVVPHEGGATPPSLQPSRISVPRHTDAVSPPTWVVERDVFTDAVTVRIDYGSAERIDGTTVIRRQYQLESRCDPSAPEASSSYGRHISTIERPTERVESRSDVLIRATATHFDVSIDLSVHVNGTLHHFRRWVESIPRILL